MINTYKKLTQKSYNALKNYAALRTSNSRRNKNGSNQPQQENDALKNFRDLSFILTIYLYFTGWVYIYHYFNSFGLSIRQIDIEFYYFLVYSINAFVYLFSHLHTILYLLAGSLLLYILYYFIRNKLILTYIPGILLFAFLYYTSYKAGIAKAERDRFFEDPTLKTVKFFFKDLDNKSSLTSSLQQNNANESLRLLTATKDEYFVVVADPLANAATIKRRTLEVFEIKKDNVTLMKIIK